MALAPNKTKLVCTIGPASGSPEILQRMLQAGMNIARLNFSHGEFAWHRTVIDNLRRAACAVGKRVTIMADLPGPKIRIGLLAQEPIQLKRGDAFTLTTNDMLGDYHREGDVQLADLLSRNLQHIVAQLAPTAVIVPAATGYAARMVSRFKLPVWIAAVSPQEATCHGLQFSYGVSPILAPEHPHDWNAFARRWVQSEGLPEELVMLLEGPSQDNPAANHRLEVIDLSLRSIPADS